MLKADSYPVGSFVQVLLSLECLVLKEAWLDDAVDELVRFLAVDAEEHTPYETPPAGVVNQNGHHHAPGLIHVGSRVPSLLHCSFTVDVSICRLKSGEAPGARRAPAGQQCPNAEPLRGVDRPHDDSPGAPRSNPKARQPPSIALRGFLAL